MPYPDDDLIAIHALQSYLFCKRQVTLTYLHQIWHDNLLTVQGDLLHQRVHEESIKKSKGAIEERGLALRSLEYGIQGKADYVKYSEANIELVEYKRGKPKTHKADEVQLMAQALCLEEMKGTTINKGYLFYNEIKHRTEIPFNEELRALTVQTIAEVRKLIETEEIPLAHYTKACELCAQKNHCLPKLNKSAREYMRAKVVGVAG